MGGAGREASGLARDPSTGHEASGLARDPSECGEEPLDRVLGDFRVPLQV